MTLKTCRLKWNHFVKDNIPLVIEVCQLEERGYPLAPSQQDLTTLQKIFLHSAYPIYFKLKREASKNNYNDTDTDLDEEEQFKQRYREMQRENQRKHDERVKMRLNHE